MSKVYNPQMPRTGLPGFLVTVLLSLWLPGTVRPQALVGSPGPTRPLVEVRTRFGTMVWALYNETPIHRDHFLGRLRDGVLDSLLFHRVVPGFGVVGGDPQSEHAAPGIPLGLATDSIGLPLEVVPWLIHKKGALAAAPADDRAEQGQRSHRDLFMLVHGVEYDDQELDLVAERKKTQGVPFSYSTNDRLTYAQQGGLPRLDGSYTVFGEVVSGLDVLDDMVKTPCNEWDRPLEDIRMYLRLLQ